MVIAGGKISVAGTRTEQPYYDTTVVQKRFKLPDRKEDFKGNFFSFLRESALLTYFCLRDKRFRQINNVFFSTIRRIKKRDINTPKYIKNALVELGSTFIKIGQFLSSRTDLLPKEYTDILSELQDSLPPIPFSEIKPEVEKELRKPLDRVFEFFEYEPIASASIGQVHKAKLLSGHQVVVKIQRPNLKVLFYQDLAILRCLATFLTRYTKLAKGREWVEVVDEIGKTLFEEIDFIQEGKNADRFRRNLKLEERIYIPRVYWQFTTKRLITIEFVPGIKITDIAALIKKNHNPKELAHVLVNAYFKQFFEDGFYHADPHPGNIFVRDDGVIVFYDFGMVGRINESVRRELANVLISIVGNDTETLLGTLKKLELLKPDVEVGPLKRVIEQAGYKYYDGAKLDSINLGEIEDDLRKLFRDKLVKLPSKFTYTLRMTGTLEGVCRTLDPNFSLIEVAKPYLQRWLMTRLPESESRWSSFIEVLRQGIPTVFPQENRFVEKVRVYLEVVRDLPKYVSSLEENKRKLPSVENDKDKKILTSEVEKKEINHLRVESQETDVKLKGAYAIIFLLSFVFIGNFLTYSGDFILNFIGLVLLCISVIGSVGVVAFSILNKRVLE